MKKSHTTDPENHCHSPSDRLDITSIKSLDFFRFCKVLDIFACHVNKKSVD